LCDGFSALPRLVRSGVGEWDRPEPKTNVVNLIWRSFLALGVPNGPLHIDDVCGIIEKLFNSVDGSHRCAWDDS
jgi:hypothetical protein